ncbi:hypothetical protein ACFQT0_22680 [Hymenobacter humi]|uniref:DUF4168 domain-containing protein n=1 Tax=Hymenobacter humi TaxID=1411620 RepID=A0ABW2UBZ1_9BACT
MKLLLLSSLLALATAPAVLAQAPNAATVKTKVKPAGQPSVKTKTTAASETASVAGPSDAVIDAKANALTANMQQNLGLSPQQTEKVRVINRRSIDNVETARVRYRTNPRKLAGVVESISRLAPLGHQRRADAGSISEIPAQARRENGRAQRAGRAGHSAARPGQRLRPITK